MHVLVHAGFHKTGTSSIQQGLAANRAALSPALRILLKEDMEPLTEAARAWSRRPEELEWALVLHEARGTFAALDPDDPRPVLISSEDLCGHMPFRHGLTDYAAAAPLMAGLREALAATRPDATIALLFTTRAAAPWVKSCYAQHLRATRITETAEDYAARALPHADLGAMVDRVAAAVAPAPVHRAALEDIAAGPLGPLDALLDLLPLDPARRATLTPPARANRALPAEVQDRLLALNRSDRPWSEVRDEKKRLVRRARRLEA